MNDATTALIENLANKFGTTAEHLWGVLLHQAPISGAIDLIGSVVMMWAAVRWVGFVTRKTTKPPKTEANRYPKAEWDDVGTGLAWAVTAIYLIITGAVVIGAAKVIMAAFFNPEYWALSHFLRR